jgi:hypothetical protein
MKTINYRALTTQDIKCIVMSKKHSKLYFKGVFPSDRLPSSVSLPAALVVNFDSSEQAGSHWVSMIIDCHGVCEYFDSFAMKPMIRDHIIFMKNNSRKIIYNKQCLQSLESSLCGHYCCLFIYFRSAGIPMKLFVNLYTVRNNYENDAKTIVAFLKIFSSPKAMVTPLQFSNLCCCSRQNIVDRFAHASNKNTCI